MTRFVTRERERESTLSSVQLFGDSSIVAFNPWLRFTQRIFLHGTGEEKKEKEGKEEEVGLLGNEERERVLVSRFVPVVRFFAFSDQTAKPRLIRPGSSFSFLSTSLLFSPGFLHHLRINWISFSRRCAGPGPTCSIKSLGKMS